MYIDEEGRLKHFLLPSWIYWPLNLLIYGKALFVGAPDSEGEDTPSCFSPFELRKNIWITKGDEMIKPELGFATVQRYQADQKRNENQNDPHL
jgi:hypothetical protein